MCLAPNVPGTNVPGTNVPGTNVPGTKCACHQMCLSQAVSPTGVIGGTSLGTIAILSDDSSSLPAPIQVPTFQAFAPLCAVFRRFLKSQDLKYTQERADVLDAIIARDDAFEAEELLLDLRTRGHEVSKATVYRTLRLLIDAGIITQSLFDAKQSQYELLYGKEPRDCMVCMKTGRRVEFRSRELIELRDRICRELGWQSVGHRFQIFAIAPRVESQHESPHEA